MSIYFNSMFHFGQYDCRTMHLALCLLTLVSTTVAHNTGWYSTCSNWYVLHLYFLLLRCFLAYMVWIFYLRLNQQYWATICWMQNKHFVFLPRVISLDISWAFEQNRFFLLMRFQSESGNLIMLCSTRDYRVTMVNLQRIVSKVAIFGLFTLSTSS